MGVLAVGVVVSLVAAAAADVSRWEVSTEQPMSLQCQHPYSHQYRHPQRLTESGYVHHFPDGDPVRERDERGIVSEMSIIHFPKLVL